MSEERRKVAYSVGHLSRLLPRHIGIRKDARTNTYILFRRNNGALIATRTEDQVASWKHPDRVFKSMAERHRRGIKDA